MLISGDVEGLEDRRKPSDRVAAGEIVKRLFCATNQRLVLGASSSRRCIRLLSRPWSIACLLPVGRSESPAHDLGAYLSCVSVPRGQP